MAHRSQPRREKLLEAEVERLKEQLKRANLEKNEIISEYEKLSIICRSQRQQLYGIKQALASTSPTNKSPGTPKQKPRQVQLDKNSSSPDQNSWQAFTEDLKTPTLVTSDNLKPVTTRNSHQNKSGANAPAVRSQPTVPVTNVTQSQCFNGLRNKERNLNSQPPGWAAF
ncbi:uncharacterized protein [Rutidosis leptorrhynchoides]|uniref:uncharacterized protein n=1 Tax=Rutidosis leptorrhynchoides TaxID=125765 RepID=UPI003A9A06BC